MFESYLYDTDVCVVLTISIDDEEVVQYSFLYTLKFVLSGPSLHELFYTEMEYQLLSTDLSTKQQNKYTHYAHKSSARGSQ